MGISSLDQQTKRAVFLDRDGVLNQVELRNLRPHPPLTLEALSILPGVHDALSTLRAAGFLLCVVTNQPDVARGTQSRVTVEQMNNYLIKMLPLDGFYVCYHDDMHKCNCRKPAPGLLLTAAAEHGIDLRRSYLVGDRWRDVEAGRRAGCRTAWIDMGYAEAAPPVPPNVRVGSLLEATAWILADSDIEERLVEVTPRPHT